MNTERTHIHFLSDVLVAIALLGVKVPNYSSCPLSPQPTTSQWICFGIFKALREGKTTASQTTERLLLKSHLGVRGSRNSTRCTYAFGHLINVIMLKLFLFLLFYFIAASEGGANVFEVTYFKGTVSSQST